jgi:predicted Fe-Mo cluster-binding NifX family protein
MKVIFTTNGDTLDSRIDPRFGRAQKFLLLDTGTGEFKPHDNSRNLNALQGAGVQAARTAVDLGAEAVVTGHVGPKAFAALLAAKIKVYINASGTVKDALDKFNKGELELAERPDVQGHW